MHMHQHYRHPSDSQAHYISNTQQHTANKNFSPSSATIATTSTTLTSSSTSTIRRQSGPGKDIVEVIPSSNTIDSAMYERDKQIYKCSTMKHGGKFDPKFKPAILNCPLPEIPKQEDEISRNIENSHSSNNSNNMPGSTRTYQRNLKMPGLKPIQPPKINNNISNNNNMNMNSGNSNCGTPNVENKSPPMSNNQNQNPPLPQHQYHQQQHHQQQQLPLPPPPQELIDEMDGNITADNGGDEKMDTAPKTINNPNSPPQSAINSNDESNYAVTEL